MGSGVVGEASTNSEVHPRIANEGYNITLLIDQSWVGDVEYGLQNPRWDRYTFSPHTQCLVKTGSPSGRWWHVPWGFSTAPSTHPGKQVCSQEEKGRWYDHGPFFSQFYQIRNDCTYLPDKIGWESQQSYISYASLNVKGNSRNEEEALPSELAHH